MKTLFNYAKWLSCETNYRIDRCTPLKTTELLFGSAACAAGFVALAFFSVCLIWKKRRKPNRDSLLRLSRAVTRGMNGPSGLKSPPSVSSPLSSESSASSPLVPFEPLFASSQTITKVDSTQLGSNRGSVKFTLRYSVPDSCLQVKVENCSNLPELVKTSDGQCLLDPYVKLQLLPEKQHRVKTRVVRASRNPQYDETFSMYGISQEQLRVTSLQIGIVAFDRYSRDTLLAEAVYCLADADLISCEEKSIELQLSGFGEDYNEDRGQILISLCYQPTTNRITVVLLKAQNLPKFDITGLAAKKKSQVKKRTLSPVYNESFVFGLPDVENRSLDLIKFEIVVMDWDRITKNEKRDT
ncbi:unnamed protein product [Enterobius vermicularis]|uniref:C2 domain-containing protein n=1 Tax=Enterobius vermicularis TaxID=51028 RepID=A0A158QAG2_ENTVE|nr:unnamed protein product [Enterobius vermicularis]